LTGAIREAGGSAEKQSVPLVLARRRIGAASVAFAALIAVGCSGGEQQSADAQAASGAAAASSAASQSSGTTETALLSFEEQDRLVSDYCIRCHNYDDNAGGLALLLFEGATVHEDPETAEKVIRKLRAGMMPPSGEPRPDFETGMRLAASLEASIDSHADYKPGWLGLHRLNRVEYQNVVRDLLGIEIDAAQYLPTDDSSNGFDNQAGALGLSPVLLEAYLSAAGKLAEMAVGDVSIPTQTIYRVAEDASQNDQVEGLPFGTRGGILIDHYFPADGDYAFKIFSVNLGNMGNFRPFGEVRGEQLEVLIDGERVGLFDWDKEFGITPREESFEDEQAGQLRTIDLTVPVTAGHHKVGVTFLASNYAPGLDLNNAFERTTIETGGLPGFTFYPHVGRVRIDGPYEAAGAEDAPNRLLLFVCEPESAAEEAACAEQIVANLIRRAYRGQASDEDRATLLRFYNEARAAGGDFDDGVEAALQRALSDPKFIYRIETPPANATPGESYQINDLELASRLSFFLWSSMPDEQLLARAEAGELRNDGVLEAEIERMLADSRAEELTRNFAGQWLALRNLEGHAPITANFPDFDNNLRQAFRRETELLVDSLIRENRPIYELLDANYTYVNERLARHYGIPGVRGPRFRRVELGDDMDVRRGILGHGSLMTVTSQPGRTSPVIRGNWVLGNLIGTPAPPPPPNVPAIQAKTQDAAGNARVPTIREQYEAHRTNPVCATCHNMMDPIGFSLEPFDAIGRLRDTDAGLPINASGAMYDGSPINGPQDLRAFVLRYRDAYARNVAQKMLTYAVGRGMDWRDMPVVREVVHAAEADGTRFHALILAVAQSEPFQMNTAPIEVADAEGGAPATTGARPTATSAGR
jgi:hypothetical protein